jgi:membrane protein
MLFDLRPAKDPSSIECVRLACSTVPPRRRAVHIIRQSLHILLDAFYRFNRGDGWAIAAQIALSILMSVFPFLIVVTAIAGFIGSVDLANEVTRLLFATWPQEVAGPLATEIHHVLTTSHGGLVTISAVFAVYFSSSGIESLRIGLNRAYGLRDRRSFWVLRLESIGFVLLSAIALLVVAFLVVWPAPFQGRRGLCAGARTARIALRFHAFRRLGHYLAEFAYTYVNYYAGLASAMIALVFLYYSAWIFVYGGQLNAAIARVREARA